MPFIVCYVAQYVRHAPSWRQPAWCNIRLIRATRHDFPIITTCILTLYLYSSSSSSSLSLFPCPHQHPSMSVERGGRGRGGAGRVLALPVGARAVDCEIAADANRQYTPLPLSDPGPAANIIRSSLSSSRGPAEPAGSISLSSTS